MLARLTIDNYALINHLDTSFPGDLVIITGETGAGKSILLGALALVLGARADVGTLKDQSRNCVVEAVFEEDGRETIIRRVVTPQGRSRSFVDDEPVTLDSLRSLSSRLVDIHSQNQQTLLSDSRFQLSILDGFADTAAEVKDYQSTYSEYCKARDTLSEMDAKIASAERDREFLEFQYERLAKASLKQNELQELEEEQSRLAHSEQIRSAIAAVQTAFEGGEHTLESSLKEMEFHLDKVAQYLPGFDSLKERVASSRIELKDIYEEVCSRGARVSSSPERLAQVDERLALIYELMRRHNVSSMEELIAIRDDMASRLGLNADMEDERRLLQDRCAQLEKDCIASAGQLHDRRQAAAPALSELIQNQIRFLEIPRAVFEVRVERTPGFGQDGCDKVSFMFDANDTGRKKELSQCASGGEMSRIMLCLKSIMAQYRRMPTMIFDEIDTGVSGSIADKMGRMIVDMASRMQIFAITHLPQVASKGSAHYLVYKEAAEGGYATGIRKLDADGRLLEVARMLSGSTVTEAALTNARSLLDNN